MRNYPHNVNVEVFSSTFCFDLLHTQRFKRTNRRLTSVELISDKDEKMRMMKLIKTLQTVTEISDGSDASTRAKSNNKKLTRALSVIQSGKNSLSSDIRLSMELALTFIRQWDVLTRELGEETHFAVSPRSNVTRWIIRTDFETFDKIITPASSWVKFIIFRFCSSLRLADRLCHFSISYDIVFLRYALN